jgi:hypothetical protein
MSSDYECKLCNKNFKSNSGFHRHKKRNNCVNSKIKCPHCQNPFKHKSNLYRHIKNVCKVAKQERLEKENELEELQKVKEQLNIMQKQITEKDDQLAKRDKEIDDLKQSQNQTNIQNIENIDNSQNIHGNINNIHLHINPHGQENINNLNFTQLIKNIMISINNNDNSGIIPNMFKKVIEIEENRNVYLSNIRANYGVICIDNNWTIKDMEKLLNDILLDNMERLEMFVDNNKELITTDISNYQYEQLKYNLGLYFDKIDKNKKEYDPNEKLVCMKKIKDILIEHRHIVNAFYEELTGGKIKLPK